MNYGKASVLIVNLLHRWQALKPHQSLAIVVATIAALVAMACFLIAKLLLQKRI
jgi:hypothetical protein